MDGTPRELTPRDILLYWLPVALWAAFIFYLSSLSVTPEPSAIHALPGWTQLAHFTLYLILGGLLFRASLFRSGLAATSGHPIRDAGMNPVAPTSFTLHWQLPASIELFGGLYAFSDELHQLFVPGRQADPADIAVDLVGLTAAILIGLLWLRFRRDRGHI